MLFCGLALFFAKRYNGSMKTNRIPKSAAIFLLCIAAAVQAGAAASSNAKDQMVSLQSLLEEMLDREAPARWPIPAYACKQASSHDRRKQDPKDAEGWHSNTDYGQFIRTEVNEGRQEWVIMEDQGPGAIVRFWIPLLAEKDQQTSTLKVTVTADGKPLPGATVTLTSPTHYSKATTDESGKVTLPLSSDGDQVTLTVSKNHYLPYQKALD